MKLEVEDVKEMVADQERKLSDYREAAALWERMWRLEPFTESPRTKLDIDGVEAIATSDPYNIMLLVTRMVASEARFEVPYLSATETDDKRSEKLEDWLAAFWRRASRQQGRNLIQDMTWHSGVRGRGAMEVIWVRDVLPKRLRDRRLPILPRILDPMNVGVCRGPWGPEYAYHKYDAEREYIATRYPDYKLDEPSNGYRPSRKQYKVVDFWYADNSLRTEGGIYHCVLVNDEFAKAPTRMDYPEIPIVEWTGDGAPVEDEIMRSLSILHPLKDLWPYKSRLVSQIGTGLLYYFYPIYKWLNPTNEPWKGDLTVRPGADIELTGQQNLEALRTDPNVPLAQAMLQIVDTQIQQSTFPSVMYGEEGGASSGYAINQLANSARGRINTMRVNQEAALEAANEIILSLVEIFGEDEGVVVSGKSAHGDGRGKPIKLEASDIKGSYETDVSLIPEIPTDETQRITTWLQLVKEGIVSKQTFRDKILNIPLPRDEDLRISVEQAMAAPDMGPKKILYAIRKWYKEDDWRRIIAGTQLDQLEQQEEQWLEQQEAEKEAKRQAKRQAKEQEKQQADQAAAMQEFIKTGQAPQGWHMMPDGTLMSDKEMLQNGMPPSSPLSPMMPGSPGQPLAPGMPPGLPGMPPNIGQPPGLPGPMPPELAGMPPGMQPPGIPGLPPEAAGQLTPEMLGIPPGGGPGAGPPGMFDQLTGAPLTDEEIQRLLMQQGQGGPPPMP